jgi:hypothetical protein
MTTRTRITASIATGLIAAALVPAAAVGYTETGTPSAGGGSDLTFVPKLPRSADAAVPFVANVSPEAAQQVAAVGDDGFEWGDALIGAGAALAIGAIALAGAGALSTRRRRYTGAPRGTASQGV